jgi:hypothetical protein
MGASTIVDIFSFVADKGFFEHFLVFFKHLPNPLAHGVPLGKDKNHK